MELLRVEHTDFILQVDCDKFLHVWDKAVRNLREKALTCRYAWSEGVQSACINGIPVLPDEEAKAIFFDNADYPLWVEFKTRVREASFNSPSRKVAESFRFHPAKQILSGFLNYGNEIGKSEIIINYTLPDGERKKFRLTFEVLSTKLNYHEHWREIISDIEKEYRMLSIDFLKKTFHSFEISEVNETTHDLIWWQVFRSLREEFVAACKSILDRPRHRLKDQTVYQRADKIRRFNPLLENEFARFKKDSGHLYRTDIPAINNDTYENRFLKHAIASIATQHASLGHRILNSITLSEDRRREIEEEIEELEVLGYHSFFRNVGPFKGLIQDSLILQKDTFYSSVYRTWLILQQSYSLNEGLHFLETKDIATLYEIWCYIQMKEVVRGQLGEGIEIDNSSRTELNGLFRHELAKGDRSRILFRKEDVELAELIYNPTQDQDYRRGGNVDGLVSRTVPQKPDIVLRLSKTEREHDLKLTYLFDAKYRIDSKDSNDVDLPPNDAINQMHRYRDAIYYKEHDDKGLKKEIIGGYILFPGNGKPAEVEVADFFKSIKEVNIGAFPLRPKDKENRKLLENFVRDLLNTKASSLLSQSNVIPQKGLKYEPDEQIVGDDPVCLIYPVSPERLAKYRGALTFYVRTGDRVGALPFDAQIAKVSKIIFLPNPISKDTPSYIFSLRSEGAKIYSGNTLKDKGFEIKEENLAEPYLAFELSPDAETIQFSGLESNPNIPGKVRNPRNPAPHLLTWSALNSQ